MISGAAGIAALLNGLLEMRYVIEVVHRADYLGHLEMVVNAVEHDGDDIERVVTDGPPQLEEAADEIALQEQAARVAAQGLGEGVALLFAGIDSVGLSHLDRITGDLAGE